MRLKPVPAAPDDPADADAIDDLWAAREAVPLVPKPEDDCCRRVMDRYGVDARDDARTWLTFLRALGLVAESDRGFHRTRDDPDRGDLAARFRDGVFAAREVLDALDAADDPLDGDAAFEAVADVVPEWEKHKDPDWEHTWRERVGRLLDWAVLFGLAVRVDGGYRAV